LPLEYPLSTFMSKVLRVYGIRTYHLSPRSILDLAVFAHLCEAFFATPPNLRLFRYLYKLKMDEPVMGRVACFCYFTLRADMTDTYIFVRGRAIWASPEQRCPYTLCGESEPSIVNTTPSPTSSWCYRPTTDELILMMLRNF
jgi:hypothetical protein